VRRGKFKEVIPSGIGFDPPTSLRTLAKQSILSKAMAMRTSQDHRGSAKRVFSGKKNSKKTSDFRGV
jgi:hypothetical protein